MVAAAPIIPPLGQLVCVCLRPVCVRDVGRAARLSREPAADSEYRTFDFSVTESALRCLTVDCPPRGLPGGRREEGEEEVNS